MAPAEADSSQSKPGLFNGPALARVPSRRLSSLVWAALALYEREAGIAKSCRPEGRRSWSGSYHSMSDPRGLRRQPHRRCATRLRKLRTSPRGAIL